MGGNGFDVSARTHTCIRERNHITDSITTQQLIDKDREYALGKAFMEDTATRSLDAVPSLT